MKTLKNSFLALVVGLTSLAFAQVASANIDDLIAALQEDPANAAEMVESVVSDSPDQASAIVNRLLAQFPDLAEGIVNGAISGLPTPLSEEAVLNIVSQAILSSPGVAPEIVLGARQAAPGLQEAINRTAQRTLRQIAAGRGAIGRTTADSVAQTPWDDITERVISPSN